MHRFRSFCVYKSDWETVPRTLRDIAGIYEEQDEMMEAIKHAERALRLLEVSISTNGCNHHLLGVCTIMLKCFVIYSSDENRTKCLGRVGQCNWQNTTPVYADILENKRTFLCVFVSWGEY